MIEWINVQYSLPQSGDEVLSAAKNKEGNWIITRTKYFYYLHSGHAWELFSSGCGCCDRGLENVTHWMPLPKPPVTHD